MMLNELRDLYRSIPFKNETKLRELVDQAFEADLETQDYFLGLAVQYYMHYPYRSIHPQEKAFYDRLFAMVLNDKEIMNEWMTPSDVEREFGFSESWQNKARMVSSKLNFPFYKPAGFIRYKRSEINQWIEDHKVQ